VADGSSKTLVNTGRDRAGVRSVAISSDGRLVAAGGFDNVRDLQSFGGIYPEHTPIGGRYLGRSYRWIVGDAAGTQNRGAGCDVYP